MADGESETPPKRGNPVKLGEKLANLKRLARDFKRKLKEAETERDSLKARPDTAALEGKVKELSGSIRAEKHRKAFDQAAAKAKVRPEALDDLWELSKLDTSAEEPDADAIAVSIAEKTKNRPYLIDADGSPAPKNEPPAPPPPLGKGQGSGRGGREQPAGFTVSSAQLADAAFMRQNQARIGEASAQGLLTVTD